MFCLPNKTQSQKIRPKKLFFNLAFTLIENDSCPLCETPWNAIELKEKVGSKIKEFERSENERALLRKKLDPIALKINSLIASLSTISRYGKLASPPIQTEKIPQVRVFFENLLNQIDRLSQLDEVIAKLKLSKETIATTHEETDRILSHFSNLPEKSIQETSREKLIIAHERFTTWRTAEQAKLIASKQAKIASHLLEKYSETSNSFLTSIYNNVQHEFASLYEEINHDDEPSFSAQLTPTSGKLSLNVDFYGRGFFPPGAYHSEGHQDGMGICLYLALMRYLNRERFTLAIFDDVLMSVDVGHRRKICSLLKRKFPETQFIMTTHDPIWLRTMSSEGLVRPKSAVHFRRWTVDHGPSEWGNRDAWSEIEEYLANGDVRSAASLLRNFLEFSASEFCHNLRASVPFREDALYQLGDLLFPAFKRLNDLYSDGIRAAESWDQQDKKKFIDARSQEFKIARVATNENQWSINSSVHFNYWNNISADEFRNVVIPFRKALESFYCANCLGPLKISPNGHTPDALRCECGEININLKRRKN